MSLKVLIVGAGRNGVAVADLLTQAGHSVTVVESSAARVAAVAVRSRKVDVVCGSGTDAVMLERAGARAADAFAALTGVDEVNLLATSLARYEFDVPRVIGRVVDPANAWMYTPIMGVDVALDQAELMAHLVAEELSLGEMTTLLKLRRGQYALVEERVHPAAAVVGTPVRELRLPPRCVLVAVLRGGDPLIVNGATVLLPQDEVLAVVHSEHAAELAALLDEAPPLHP